MSVKTFAEMVSRSPTILRGPYADIVAKLKMPGRNHSSERFEGRIERYLFRGASPRLVQEVLTRDSSKKTDAIDGLKLPHEECWVEADFGNCWLGYFCKRYADRVFVVTFGGVPGIDADCVEFADIAPGREPVMVAAFPDTAFGRHLAYRSRETCGRRTEFAIYLLAVICSPHIASIERVVPRGISARRREQRGFPVFSHNIVQMKVPETARQRGEVRETSSPKGRRLSVTRGHWRLIQWPKDCEPYFVWVDEYESGDEKLGAIVKTRDVVLNGTSARRGFVLPQFPGAPGMRVRATKGPAA